ncbi:hypothetical protein BGZ63DRAFT_370469, partial [Mariannaea sp. PMI_226]
LVCHPLFWLRILTGSLPLSSRPIQYYQLMGETIGRRQLAFSKIAAEPFSGAAGICKSRPLVYTGFPAASTGGLDKKFCSIS